MLSIQPSLLSSAWATRLLHAQGPARSPEPRCGSRFPHLCHSVVQGRGEGGSEAQPEETKGANTRKREAAGSILTSVHAFQQTLFWIVPIFVREHQHCWERRVYISRSHRVRTLRCFLNIDANIFPTCDNSVLEAFALDQVHNKVSVNFPKLH